MHQCGIIMAQLREMIFRKESVMCDYNNLFKEIAQCRSIEEQAKRKREALEAEIKSFMEEQNITELIGDEHRALYKEVVSSRFDTASFKKAMPDIAEKFMKTSSTMRFNFS